MTAAETGLQVAGVALPADANLIELWLHERSPHTKRAYRADVGRFRSRAGKPLRAVTLADLQEFANSMTGYFFFQKTDKRALIPRPETDLLVEFAVKAAKELSAADGLGSDPAGSIFSATTRFTAG